MQTNRPADPLSAAIGSMRSNPVHMYRHKELVHQYIETQGENFKRKGSYSEEEFFRDNETITLYLDFLTPIFPVGSRPLDERRSHGLDHQHRHDFFEMYYVYSGNCYCYLENREFLLTPGSVWIVNTKRSHGIVLADKETNLVNILVRSSTFSDTLMNILDSDNLFYRFFFDSVFDPDVSADYMAFQIEPDSMAQLHLSNLIREYAKLESSSQTVMMCLFCCLLVELSRQYQDRLTQEVTDKLNLCDLIGYISENYKTVTLADLSQKFHYSTHYISEFLLQQTGSRFRRIVNQIRLKKAKEMLANTETNIDTITLLAGYEYRSSFEAAFKKEFHLTPKQYRNQLKKQDSYLYDTPAGLTNF